MARTSAGKPARVRVDDCVATGPGTLAGRYLRQFWQPVYHAPDLLPGRAAPLRVLGEDFTLYRGEAGAVHLVAPRCAHRGTRLHTGWVEGDCVRCFYHGWKFDGAGQCVEQPAETAGFARKVRIRSYPTREYLGLIFAFLGEGEPPEFPRYLEFEQFDGVIELDSYTRRCNYFQNVENALDMSHVGFVHHDNSASFAGIGHGQTLAAVESPWGIAYTATRPNGEQRVNQFGMPNIFHMNALPTDREIGWQESLFWWVPIDDERHVQFSLHRLPIRDELAERYLARRAERRARECLAHEELAERILAGELRLADVDTTRVDLVRLQDDIAQVGQGRIADRGRERLGRGDAGLIMIRKLWLRELRALAEGRPLTVWTRPAGLAPTAWRLPGAVLERTYDWSQPNPGARPAIVDVRVTREAVGV
jgi:5,5'-dehydrodivanillate O-demethylase